MKTNYNWQTDDDSEWPADAGSAPTPPARRPGRGLLLAFVVAVAVLAAAFILFDRRLSGREAAVEGAVLAAQRTWEQAFERQDVELFTSLLSREDLGWYTSERRLFTAGRTMDRPALGLVAGPPQPASAAVTLDPNWRQASVEFEQAYTLENDAQPQSLTLRQIHRYRLAGSRWLLAALDADQWGAMVAYRTPRLAVTYPRRDEALVRRLADDLDADLEAQCDGWEAVGRRPTSCAAETRLAVEFDTAPSSLRAASDPTMPALRGRAFVLPAPSLVGLPVSDADYDILYRAYTDRILHTVRNSVEQPAAFPEQSIASLCFPAPGERLGLFTYSPAADTWERVETEEPVQFLRPLRGDAGLILRAGPPGVDVGRLRLSVLRDGTERFLTDEGSTELLTRLVALPDTSPGEVAVLSYSPGGTGPTSYGLLSISDCGSPDCAPRSIEGFPVWSPDGARTLITSDGALYLGDADARTERFVGRGFSPFWLTADTFGYAALGGGAVEGRDVDVVLQSVSGGDQVVIAQASGLLAGVGDGGLAAMRIRDVAASPADPRLLFIAGTPVASESNDFYVLRLALTGDVDPLSPGVAVESVAAVVQTDDLPVGDPSVLTPTGYPLFSITGDGRWLVVVHFDDQITNQWTLRLYNIPSGETRTVVVNYPPYPAQFPFYDWSADWRWLVVVDNGYLRLVAPDYDYQRAVTHEFAACRYLAWVGP